MNTPVTLTIRDVERAVCLRFQMSHQQMLEKNPRRAASRPRQIAMYLARELTGASFPRLGQHFQRDHTSVLYGCQMTALRLAHDARLRTDIEGCKEILARLGSWKQSVARTVRERGLASARPAALSAQEIEANKDRADRFLRRGKYAVKYE